MSATNLPQTLWYVLCTLLDCIRNLALCAVLPAKFLSVSVELPVEKVKFWCLSAELAMENVTFWFLSVESTMESVSFWCLSVELTMEKVTFGFLLDLF